MSLPATKAPPASPNSPGLASKPGRSRKQRMSIRLAKLDLKASPYLYVAPFFVVFGIFSLYPMIWTVWMSLNDWNLIGDHHFIGLDNYVNLAKDDYFWNAVGNTFGMFLLATIPQLLLALFLANLLNRPMLRAKTFFRMAIFVPNVTAVAAVAIVFGMLFQRDFGVFNWLLHFVGVDPIDWRAEKWSSWLAISVMVDWRWTGYNTLILLAGMQAIPKDLFEAAAIDGASAWRQFWSVTLPMLRPTFLFVVILSTIGGLQLFTEPLVFGNGTIMGGVQREFQTVAMYMYEKGITNLNTAGYGAAVAWALFMLIVLVSLVNFAVTRRTLK